MAKNLQICEISPEVKQKMKSLKFRKLGKDSPVSAIILKIKSDTRTVEIDEEVEDLDFDDMEELLSESQPRYVLLSYVHKKDDGRITFPFCFIFVSPAGCQPTLTMMYSGTHDAVVQAADATKVFKVRSADELTEEFIKMKLDS
ncbi:hypothetical protein ACOMHN_020796 [Nucella lapillus]